MRCTLGISMFSYWLLWMIFTSTAISDPPPQDPAEISRRVLEELVSEIANLKMKLQKSNEELMTAKQQMEELEDEKHSCRSTPPSSFDHRVPPREVILYYLGDNDKSARVDNESIDKPLHGPKTIHNRYNGETVRTIPTSEEGQTNAGNGISGTDSAAMITMELLAQHHPSRLNNDSLFLYQASHVMDGTYYQGVHYLTHINATIAAQVTTLIVPSVIDQPALSQFMMVHDKSSDQEIVDAFRSLQRLVFVGHTIAVNMNVSTVSALIQRVNEKGRKPLQVSAVHFSPWSYGYTKNNSDPLLWSLIEQHFFIPNPVFWDMIDQTLLTKEVIHDRKDWIHHAMFYRGGPFTVAVFCELHHNGPPELRLDTHNASLHILDYRYSMEIDPRDWANDCPGVINFGSRSKQILFDLLVTTKYFLYIPIFPSALVHKDMFPISVLEAILLGVRVITLPFGPLLSAFGDHGLVDFIPVSNQQVLRVLQDHSPMIAVHGMFENSSILHIMSFIKTLDQEDFTKERTRRMIVARRIFSEVSFTTAWLSALT